MALGIEKEKRATFVVDKSHFIAIVFPLASVEEVAPLLASLRQEHPNARHVCYAYLFAPLSHSSDDGEPSGTAGRPLLELLHKKDVDRVLLAVVRYFGGTKLGAGRLLRSYLEAANRALAMCRLGSFQNVWEAPVRFPYALLETLKHRAGEFSAIFHNFVYNEKVEATLTGNFDAWEYLTRTFPEMEIREPKKTKEILVFKEEK